MKVSVYLTHTAPPDFGGFWRPETLRAIAAQLEELAATGLVSNDRIGFVFTLSEPMRAALSGLPA